MDPTPYTSLVGLIVTRSVQWCPSLSVYSRKSLTLFPWNVCFNICQKHMLMLKLSMAEDNYKNQSVFTKVLLNFKCVYTKNLGMSLIEKNEITFFVINSLTGKKNRSSSPQGALALILALYGTD